MWHITESFSVKSSWMEEFYALSETLKGFAREHFFVSTLWAAESCSTHKLARPKTSCSGWELPFVFSSIMLWSFFMLASFSPRMAVKKAGKFMWKCKQLLCISFAIFTAFRYEFFVRSSPLLMFCLNKQFAGNSRVSSRQGIYPFKLVSLSIGIENSRCINFHLRLSRVLVAVVVGVAAHDRRRGKQDKSPSDQETRSKCEKWGKLIKGHEKLFLI